MIRAFQRDGAIFIGLTRSSLELLEKGEQLVSPAYDDIGPVIVLEFAENDAALRDRLLVDGRLQASTSVRDKRSS